MLIISCSVPGNIVSITTVPLAETSKTCVTSESPASPGAVPVQVPASPLSRSKAASAGEAPATAGVPASNTTSARIRFRFGSIVSPLLRLLF